VLTLVAWLLLLVPPPLFVRCPFPPFFYRASVLGVDWCYLWTI